VVNCEYQDDPVPVSRITASGATATATTKQPHGRQPGQWLVITGALEDSQPSVHFNGSCLITQTPDAFTFSFEFFQPTPPTAVYEPTGEMWIGKTSSEIVGIKHTVPSSYPDPYNPNDPKGVMVEQTGWNPDQWTVTVITDRPHLRVPGDNVALSDVRVDGDPSTVLNRLFRITEVPNPAKLRFVLDSNPGEPDAVQRVSAQINPGYAAISADGGVGAVVEHNRVYHTHVGFFHDTWASKDLVVRKNYFASVVTGTYQLLLGGTLRAGVLT
jgi:hypothetical protein